jgi:citrate synthase
MSTAKLILDGKEYEFPVTVGSEGEVGIDISKLRDKTGAITLDDGYGNTGSCKSAITFIDGDRGILRYRGIPIDEIAGQASFVETAFLLIYGHLPNAAELAEWKQKLTYHSLIHEDMKKFFEGYSTNAHPMAILSAMVATLSTYYPNEDPELDIVRLIAKVATISAFSYKKSIGQPFVYPRNDLSYTENFLHMMYAVPAEPHSVAKELDDALNMLLIRTARRRRCAWSARRTPTSSRRSPRASAPCGARVTAAPTRKSSRCSTSSPRTAVTTRSTSTWRRTRTRASS